MTAINLSEKPVDIVLGYLGDKQQQKYKVQFLVESAFEKFQKPHTVIFLSALCVLSDTSEGYEERLKEKLNELFQKSIIVKGKKGGAPDLWGYTDDEERIALIHCFSAEVIARLDLLITSLSKEEHVSFVLTTLKTDHTIDQLRIALFTKYKFSRTIIDRIIGISKQDIGTWMARNEKALGIKKSVILMNKKDLSTSILQQAVHADSGTLFLANSDKFKKSLTNKPLKLAPSARQKQAEGKRAGQS